MRALDDLDPETQAHVLVGHFLCEFAIAEELVTECLAGLLVMDDMQRAMFLDDMPVGRKFKALKEVAPHLPRDIDGKEIERCAGVLLKANSEVRIHVAHKVFGPGIKALVVSRPGWKGEVLAAWTVEEFQHRIGLLLGTRRSLLHLSQALAVRASNKIFADIGARLAASGVLLPSAEEN